MKPSFKKTLMTVTILSAGIFALSSGSADAAYKKPEAKKTAAANTSFQQYPKLGEVKDDVNTALDLHQTAASLLSEKQQLEEYKESIEKYNEIERRLAQNTQCNVSQLSEHFSDGGAVWKKVSAWAEDSASALLAEASDSLSDEKASSQLSSLEAKVNAGDSSQDASTTVSASDSQYASIDENTTTQEAMAMVDADTAKAETATTDMDMNEAAAYGKVRWDVGNAVLKDVYANAKKWGRLTKPFTPWVDQKHVYDVYLNNFYAELEEHYTEIYYVTGPDGTQIKQFRAFPARPSLSASDSYLPEDHYNGEVPDIKASTVSYKASGASADDKWCGASNGKKNVCARINKGKLYQKHLAYVAALQSYSLKSGFTAPKMEAPYLPQKPLPPWREAVYIMNVEKEIPELASDLPDPWFKVTQSIENFTSKGELSNLVERHKNTVRYRPEDYDAETGEIKNNSDGTPKMPLPLMTNRISSYLMLVSAKEEQEPVKERAVASIKEMNENIIATLEKAGYTVPDAAAFDLSNEADYNMALRKMAELQNAKINSARAKMQSLRASFGGKLLPSVTKILEEETTTMNALQKDTEFLIGVTRDNAAEINSLLMTAAADATANQTYKENLENSMEELAPIPPVGCPVL